MSNHANNKQKSWVGKIPTFAVMLDGVDGPYQLGVLAGMLEAVAGAGANLLCFVGGHSLGRDSSEARTHIYELISPTVADGVVVLASTLIHTIGRSGLAQYCRRTYGSLPLCTVGVELDGFPAITIDNERGVRDVVSHLVRDHGYRRIAFVRGPPVNDEAEMRFCAYRSALKELRVTYDQKLVVDGDFMPASGAEAVRKLAQVTSTRLDEIDCIMAANDAMAMGLIESLEARGIAVPRCVAVTGFDDSEDARHAPPPLTTVRQPLQTMGSHAIRTLLEWTHQPPVPSGAQLSTELVLRRSCGCTLNKAMADPSERGPGAEAMTLQAQRQQIVDVLTRTARGLVGPALPSWQAKLVNAIFADIGSSEPSTFLSLVNEMVDKSTVHGAPLEPYEQVIEALRKQLLAAFRSDAGRRDKADELLQGARLVVCEAGHRALARDRLRLGRGVMKTHSVCGALASCFNLPELRACIQQQLPQLGIESYFVVLYRRGQGPQNSELLVARERGSKAKLGAGVSFAGCSLLPLEWMSAITNGPPFVVMPLAWKQECFGHILLELHLDRAFMYVPVAEAITTAVRGARLSAGNAKATLAERTQEVQAELSANQPPSSQTPCRLPARNSHPIRSSQER